MHRIALGLVLGLAGTACAQEAVDHARETLAKIRAVRAEREAAASAAPAPATWGHHLKEPEIKDPPPPEKELPRPELKPTGTVSMWGGVKVLVGDHAYGVGEEILPGWRVRAILGRKLWIESGKRVFDYLIP